MQLYVTTCQRIVAKHRHMAHITVDATRHALESLARTSAFTREDAMLVDHLERSTGHTVRELVEIAKRWPS
jgi:hypothetical protein